MWLLLKGSAGRLTVFSHLSAPYRGTFHTAQLLQLLQFFLTFISSLSSLCGFITVCLPSMCVWHFHKGSCWLCALFHILTYILFFVRRFKQNMTRYPEDWGKIWSKIFAPCESTTGMCVSVLVLTACWTSAGKAAFWSQTDFAPKTCPTGVEGSLRKRWVMSHLEQKQLWLNEMINQPS